MKKKERKIPNVQLPKNALKRINLGQSFAEYDKLLYREGIFVTTPAMEAALDPTRSKCFFVGRRGTGKTAFTFYLRKASKWAFLLAPELNAPWGLQIDTNSYKDTRQRPFKSLVSSFKRALVDQVLSEWTRNGMVGFSNFPTDLMRERNFIETSDFDQRLRLFLDDSISYLSSQNEREWKKQINRSKIVAQHCDEIGAKHKLQAILMIDQIDEGWDGSDTAVIFLMALMHSCVEISSSMNCVRPLLFLRENIFERVRQLDNEFSRLETCVVSLDWTKELLLQLIERRLNSPFNTKLALGGATWDYFFENAAEKSSRDLVFEYCQERPRDILVFCSFAIENAQSHLQQKVLLQDLQEARRSFSDSRLKDLGDEYAENFPNISLVLTKFYGLGKEYTLSGITAFIKKLLVDASIPQHCREWIYSYTSPERFIELFYNIGFFGVKDEKGVDFRSMGVKSSNPIRITRTTHAVVHTSYVDALNLQDLVIGSLDEHISLRDQGLIVDLPQALNLGEYNDRVQSVLDKLDSTEKGTKSATAFEDIVGDTIRLCFFRGLSNLEAKSRNLRGIVIRDWIAANVASQGFWEIIRQRYKAVQIVWECKNYENLAADDFHQASYYMSDATGRFVIIVFRGERKRNYDEHIKRIFSESKGIVLLLSEKDLRVFLRQALSGKDREAHIQQAYDRTIRTIS